MATKKKKPQGRLENKSGKDGDTISVMIFRDSFGRFYRPKGRLPAAKRKLIVQKERRKARK